MKSGVKDPPRFYLSLANIAAKLSGEICLAASIRIPEIPIEIKSVI